MRKPMVAGNWKMNNTIEDTKALVDSLVSEIGQIEAVDLVVCPSFVSLAVATRHCDGSTIKVGAQNMYWKESGAYTGEVAPAMLKEVCDYVIIGHSERRAMFGETDESVNLKVKAALAVGLKPIICVGETLEENQAGRTAEVVSGQVREGLKSFTAQNATNMVIAYEPVWAIGTGLAATPEGANEVHRDVVRPILKELFGEEVGEEMRILYGGSVKPDNVTELFEMSDIDGGLIGGASLKADAFVSIVKAAFNRSVFLKIKGIR
ncbi:MAG: triose-phosphate isomerase [Anaerolineaceae bacterium]|nr:triose-phosphate isomerase [Anaerolineaceae bacterium]